MVAVDFGRTTDFRRRGLPCSGQQDAVSGCASVRDLSGSESEVLARSDLIGRFWREKIGFFLQYFSSAAADDDGDDGAASQAHKRPTDSDGGRRKRGEGDRKGQR